MTPTRFAALLLALMALGAVVWLALDRPARAPSSGFAPEAFLSPVEPGGRLCVQRERVPAGATGVQLTLGAYGRVTGNSISVQGLRARVPVIAGRARFREGQDVLVPFSRPAPESVVVEMCLSNTGRNEFAVGGKPGFGPSIRYPDARRSSWLGVAGDVGERFQRVRFAPLGAASAWVFLAFAFGGVLLGTGVVLAVSRR